MLLGHAFQPPNGSLISIVDLGLALAGKKKLVVVVGGLTGKQAGGGTIPAGEFPAQNSPQKLRKLLFCQSPFSTFSPSPLGSKLLLKH